MIRHPLSPWTQRLVTLALGLVLALSLGACAPKIQQDQILPADAVWALFSQGRNAARLSTAGFVAAGSMNYAGPDKSMRVVLEFWGNPGYPLRMDMSAGFGTPIALWHENAKGIRGYFPQERKLYTHGDPRAGAARMGLGIPLSLFDLAAMICGTYDGLVPKGYSAANPMDEGGFRYEFYGQGPVSSLTLDATGRPMVFAGQLQGHGWTLEASNFDQESALPDPRRFLLTMKSGVTAVIRVKRLERRTAPWVASALKLEVPPGTLIVQLEMVETSAQ